MSDNNPEAQDTSTETAPEPSAEEVARAEAIAEVEAEMRGETAPADTDDSTNDEQTADASANPPADATDEGEDATAEQGAGAADAATGADDEGGASDPDPWADAPEAAKAEFAKAEHARKSAEGRLAAAERRLAELTAAQQRESTRTKPEPGGEDAVKTATAQFDKFAEDFPDVAEGVKPLIDVLQGQISALRAEKDAVARSVQTLGEDRLSTVYAEQEAQVIEAHPIAAEIMSDAANDRQKDFLAWQQEQPEFVRQAIVANGDVIRDASSVNRILDMYERDRGLVKDAAPAKPSADAAKRNLQRRARGGPRPSAGVQVPEAGTAETLDDIRREVERDIRNAAQGIIH